jgi:hypothetical protein
VEGPVLTWSNALGVIEVSTFSRVIQMALRKVADQTDLTGAGQQGGNVWRVDNGAAYVVGLTGWRHQELPQFDSGTLDIVPNHEGETATVILVSHGDQGCLSLVVPRGNSLNTGIVQTVQILNSGMNTSCDDAMIFSAGVFVYDCRPSTCP